MHSFDELANRYLATRDASSLRRRRECFQPIDAVRVRDATGRELIAFCSNDYLGLSHHPKVIQAMANTTVAGAGAAPLISGRSPEHVQAEATLAAWKDVDDAVLLPSGYQANLAALQAIVAVVASSGKRARFLIDKLAHASLIDAAKLVSAGRRELLRVFPHNDLAKLRRLAEAPLDDAMDVIVTESIFSMDGDAADLRGIVALKREMTATHSRSLLLMVDEAHATGLYGTDGAGLASAFGVTRDVDLAVATLGKALGVAGGAVYGSRAATDAVINAGRAYLFSTSSPPGMAAAVTAAIDVARQSGDRRTRLRANVRRLREGLADRFPVPIGGDSPIIPVILGSEALAVSASKRLREQGFLVVAIRPPTIPAGTSRLRLTVSSEHSAGQIDALLAALRSIEK